MCVSLRIGWYISSKTLMGTSETGRSWKVPLSCHIVSPSLYVCKCGRTGISPVTSQTSKTLLTPARPCWLACQSGGHTKTNTHTRIIFKKRKTNCVTENKTSMFLKRLHLILAHNSRHKNSKITKRSKIITYINSCSVLSEMFYKKASASVHESELP